MSYVIVCANCGEGYVGRVRVQRGFCRQKACQAAAQLDRTHKSREKAKVVAVDLTLAINRAVGSLIVVHDPLDRGGFGAGVVFDKEQWERMLANMTFTPGTVLKDGQGRLYEFRLGGGR